MTMNMAGCGCCLRGCPHVPASGAGVRVYYQPVADFGTITCNLVQSLIVQSIVQLGTEQVEHMKRCTVAGRLQSADGQIVAIGATRGATATDTDSQDSKWVQSSLAKRRGTMLTFPYLL